ncbi:MAG: CRTAC1 family protein [Acidobacteriota bacterium]
MKRSCWFLLFFVWLSLLSAPAQTETTLQLRRRLLADIHGQAVEFLSAAARAQKASDWSRRQQLLKQAAEKVGAFSQMSEQDPAAVPPSETKRLKGLAEELAALAQRDKTEPVELPIDEYLRALNQALPFLGDGASGLGFQGAYVKAKSVDTGAGGHASAPGPAPAQASPLDDIRQLSGRLTAVLDFVEASIGAGRTFCGGRSKDHLLESGGSGVALFDYDNDGWLDLYVVNAVELTDKKERIAHRNALYRNLGNWKFRDVSRAAGVDAAAWGNGVCAGDYDNDGDLDLYVTNFGVNFLFRNNGDGTFSEVAARAGVNHRGWDTGCSFFDADGDGDLDLYVAGYVQTDWDQVVKAERTRVWRGGPKVMAGPDGLPGAGDVYYRNEGNGAFTEVTESSGLADRQAFYGFVVLATDYDGDGRIDLYVANDSNPNFLYHNLGAGRFEDIGLASGAALSIDGRAQAGMGADSADFDGDGLLDLVVTNFAHDTDTLYRNLGGGRFEDVSQASGLAARTFKRLGWGVAFFDVDRDGDSDLLFANGHIYPQVDEHPELEETFHQKNQLLLNDGGTFRDVSEQAGSGLQVPKSSRGLAIGDLDNDGDLDVVISNMDDAPTVLENRSRSSNHWVAFQVKKDGRNRFCIGARVTIESMGRRQIREIRSGGSYLSQNDLRVYFGLGSYSGAVDVDVQLPGNLRWRWKELPADRLNRLVLDEEHRVK